jgi:Acetyltransferases
LQRVTEWGEEMVPEELYIDYKHQLQRMDGVDEVPEQDIVIWLKEMQSDPYITYRLTYDPDDKEAAGFIIVSFPPECDPDCDIFIQDLYVRPESRRKGLATELVKKTLNMYKAKDPCLFVMDKNIPAQRFWDKIFKRMPDRQDYWPGGKLRVYNKKEK